MSRYVMKGFLETFAKEEWNNNCRLIEEVVFSCLIAVIFRIK